MAPELLTAPAGGYPATFASDIYALGITIARIVLKGDHPFTSDRNTKSNSMVRGLVPPNLHDLSWDLIDLIIALTAKDPAKRPIMPLVLYHPYFALTNDKTKRHFVDHLLAHINSKENKNNSMKQTFNNHSFQEWYRIIIADTPETVEEIAEREETLKMFRKFKPKSTIESLYGPAKQYKQKITDAIKKEYDDNIGNLIDQTFSDHALFARDHAISRTFSQPSPEFVFREGNGENDANSENHTNQANSTQFLQSQLYRNRLHKAIRSKPALLGSYFWSRLADMVKNKPGDVSETAGRKKSTGEKKHQLAQLKYWITNELQWTNLFYDDREQIADKLWKTKYPKTYQASENTTNKIIRTVAKCNMSPTVLSELLNWIGTSPNSVLLHEIVQSHDPSAPENVKMILQKHWFREENFSSVHLAAFNEGNWANEIMKALLDNNRIPTVTADGLTPTHIAALNESSFGQTLLKLLLDKGANPNASFQNGTTPVHWAATNQGKYAAEILKCLLDHGGDSDKIAENGLKPIHYAMMNTGDSALKLMDLLLEQRGANVVDNAGRTLLHLALSAEEECSQKILKKLIESGENPSIGDNRKRTPLHLAARNEKNQQLELMRILLQNSSDPNAVDQSGLTPVHYAAANKGEHAHEKLKLLLACKGNLTIKDKDGLTPIHYAIINTGKCGAEMRKLVGVNPEKTNAHLNSNGETLLHRLVSKNDGQLQLVRMVIDNGGNPNATDKFGRSPVHSVITSNESLAGLDILRLLLAKGGKANLRDKEKQFTPVHYVASSLRERTTEKMKILLSSGGDVNAQGNDAITPLHLAVANSGIYGPQLIKTLLKFKANVDATDDRKQTPMHKAISNENNDIGFDAILQLVEKGANPNARDSKGLTPIHYAVRHARRNSLKIVKLLLEHGGNMNIEDNTGMTPQRLAEYCLPECLTLNENLNDEE
ncbi:Ankycorbin-like protein [Daphnia magna]|uniref:Ankycorbin-like protein n=2 Tax=Daphnia magna TaxID=35525 RepID=A0A162NAF4_9CRUS|nr:Ankycorbin-like protein [Daphnia magna]